MTQLLRRQIETLPAQLAPRATAVGIETADAHPRFADQIQQAKEGIGAAKAAVADGADHRYARYSQAAAEGRLAYLRGQASIDIAMHGIPVAPEVNDPAAPSSGEARDPDPDNPEAIDRRDAMAFLQADRQRGR